MLLGHVDSALPNLGPFFRSRSSVEAWSPHYVLGSQHGRLEEPYDCDLTLKRTRPFRGLASLGPAWGPLGAPPGPAYGFASRQTAKRAPRGPPEAGP